MNITTELIQEVWHDMRDPGAYEWWYFDAEDPSSGLSFVLIWFSGFPFSPYYTDHYERWRSNGANTDSSAPLPSDYSSFSFQLYENGIETINFIKEGRNGLFESSRSQIGVRFEKNSFTHDALRDEYRLEVDFTFPARQKEVKAEIVFASKRRISFEKKDGNNCGEVPLHQWLLSVPKADVTGKIRIRDTRSGELQQIPVKATGYHDHNLGMRPMQEYVSRWYWGRAFSGPFDLIYYVIFFRNNRYKPLTLLLLHDNTTDSHRVLDSVSFSEKSYSRGLFAPLHSRELGLHAEDVSLCIRHDRVLDSGPFYLRFSSAISLNVDNRTFDGIRGISEFLNPNRLQSAFLRLFTRSRVWRDGEPSVMYRSYNSVKHTFDWIPM
ncbi:MAG: carotenoid 1,2-hydratase [Chlorobiaceae bacterium]